MYDEVLYMVDQLWPEERFAVKPTVVIVMLAFVKVCVPIVPLPTNWNVHVSV